MLFPHLSCTPLLLPNYFKHKLLCLADYTSHLPKWAPMQASSSPSVHHLGTLQNKIRTLALFLTYGDALWLMRFNPSIYNEKTSQLFCFSSKRTPSILLTPPPPPTPCLLIQCDTALLTHTSSEGWTAITMRVLREFYARLRLAGYSWLLCPTSLR